MRLANNNQKAAIATLMNKVNIKGEAVKEMVQGFTNGRTDSRANLHFEEANAMIRHLKELDPDYNDCNRMRGKILALAHEMFWHIPGTTKIDMKRIDEWCMKLGKYKKRLNQHLKNELPALITQFEHVHASFLKNL
ncbi:hypothetical protein D3C72_700780 [compost metagenome]